MKHLVIVESPTKRRTIGKYLADLEGDFDIEASVGHIRDLATKGKEGLGVDVENGFIPRYEIDKDKVSVVAKLKKAARQADEVILATDPDREGEAIAWHLAEVLGLDVATAKRIEFHEITRDSIKAAMAAPRTIDLDMKASQETRRILDRISGFKLSKLLQKRIKSRSAGRVQSVALKLIVDREREIEAFIPVEYWTMNATVTADDKPIQITLAKVDGKKADINNGKEAKEIKERLGATVELTNVKKTERKKEPRPPFTTSTLQQEAFSKFRFLTKRTSALAQMLYEGIKIGEEEVGLITYTRTDSTRLSETYINRAKNYIIETYGNKYVAPARRIKAGLLAQDAHEAIRPTSNHRTPESIRAYLTDDQFKLYQLIYNRALASLMPDKIEEVTNYTFEANGLQFSADGYVTKFDGFSIVYPITEDNEKTMLPPLDAPLTLPLKDVDMKQNFTKAPPRFSEAKLVEEMEKNGIGRPSTYAATIETLKARSYVTAKAGVLTPTDQGKCTVTYLETYFKSFINPQFTATMEKQLDEVKDGNSSSVDILTVFYNELTSSIGAAGELPEGAQCKKDLGPCPKCGIGRLVEQNGKYGKFTACNRFPECKYIHKEPKEPPKLVGRKCPLCGHDLIEKKSLKKGKPFIGCSAFPKCRYIENVKEDKGQA